MPPEISYRLILKGLVQGLGIRPRLYLLAKRYNLKGCVQNTFEGVQLDIQGYPDKIDAFLIDLEDILDCSVQKHITAATNHYQEFSIVKSQGHIGLHPIVSPDRAPCPTCLQELFDPLNRRYLYPFITCLACGPRYSMLEHLPYDRASTSMHAFTMCQSCQDEYDASSNRRFHSQTNSCGECGPKVWLCDDENFLIKERHEAILKTISLLKEGHVIGVKGIGGFHLIADATSSSAIRAIRQLKSRAQKPLAIMVQDLETAQSLSKLSSQETQALCSLQGPIVLAKKKTSCDVLVSDHLAPNLKRLGIMLPCSPLHALLSHLFKKPLVVTSANRKAQSILSTLDSMQQTFGKEIYYLTHNRDILHSIDDSVVKEIAGNICILRKARGYVPYQLDTQTPRPSILSLGGHLKSTVAITRNQHILLSPYIGDLDSIDMENRFKQETNHLLKVSEPPQVVVHDNHPDYTSTLLAKDYSDNLISVQHHHAHILACMAEYQIYEKVLGFAWDGNGYGLDGTLWGGEALICEHDRFARVASFKPFSLPGGEKAFKEPMRVATSLLYETFTNPESIIETIPGWYIQDVKPILKLLDSGVESPQTSSVGRLFDGVASLLSLCMKSKYESQAAMMLEDICDDSIDTSFSMTYTTERGLIQIDWQSMLKELVASILNKEPSSSIAMRFHHWLVDGIILVAKQTQIKKIALSGGVFQNDMLSRLAKNKLQTLGFEVYIPQDIPMNDSGLSVGQIWAAVSSLKQESEVNDVFRHTGTTKNHSCV